MPTNEIELARLITAAEEGRNEAVKLVAETLTASSDDFSLERPDEETQIFRVIRGGTEVYCEVDFNMGRNVVEVRAVCATGVETKELMRRLFGEPADSYTTDWSTS